MMVEREESPPPPQQMTPARAAFRRLRASLEEEGEEAFGEEGDEGDDFMGVPGEMNPDLFEGDILPSYGGRNANARKRLWPGGVVPYEFDEEITCTSSVKRDIRNALSILNQKSVRSIHNLQVNAAG